MSLPDVERGRRLPPDERREQILRCASELFAARPYTEVSVSEIARTAGVARGLVNHYFGDKRGIYLEILRRAVLLPVLEDAVPAGQLDGVPLERRVELAVSWFLDSVEPHAASYFTILGAGGVAEDPEVARILDEGDDLAARRTLELLGLDAERSTSRAAVRAYGGMAKATVREWVRTGALTREQAHALLRDVLMAVVATIEAEASGHGSR
ncbi:TetR/AcrR family transcriptional regulator [Nocardioides fonticola]|uniref:TetR/AcrR family transcriptional regulator n=1 Tax=Nocardioides fonticola TaxID=450363 RepID=UPI0031DA110B